MKISLIVAMDTNNVIGNNGDLPWKLPKELEYVKKTTMGYPIILGRRNFESIGKALPGRRNIIVTRDKSYSAEGCEVVNSLEETFKITENEKEIFIFGGEEIYRLFLPYVDKLYITKIYHEFEGNIYFPKIEFEKWDEVSVSKGIIDENNPYTYYFHVYEKKSSLHFIGNHNKN
ncbi:Dihydrofolate reductase [compost metagenome]